MTTASVFGVVYSKALPGRRDEANGGERIEERRAREIERVERFGREHAGAMHGRPDRVVLLEDGDGAVPAGRARPRQQALPARRR